MIFLRNFCATVKFEHCLNSGSKNVPTKIFLEPAFTSYQKSIAGVECTEYVPKEVVRTAAAPVHHGLVLTLTALGTALPLTIISVLYSVQLVTLLYFFSFFVSL